MVVRAGAAREGFLSCASVQENGDTGRVFVYGTLQSLPVVRALLQREPRRRRALLFGAYEGPFRVRGQPYPGVLAPDALPVEPRDRAQSSTSLGVGQDASGPASATADPGASSSASQQQHFISGWVLEGLSVEELELLDFFEDDDEYERLYLIPFLPLIP
eukprot:g2433.t1